MLAARIGSRAASAARLWNRQPLLRTTATLTPALVLYEYEASPWCRRVRETLGALGLEALIKPCPRETLRAEGAYGPSSRFRAEASTACRRLSFPLLIDKTANVVMSDSMLIMEHLWLAYGDGVERPMLDRVLNTREYTRSLVFDFPLLVSPSALRPWPWAGVMLAPSRANKEPLILYGCEADADSRLVREALCALQLSYHSRPRSLAAPLPALEDPNTGFATVGAEQALRYLDETYRTGEGLSLLAPMPTPNLGEARLHPVLSRLLGRDAIN